MIKSTFNIVLLGLAMLFFIGNTKVIAQVSSKTAQNISKSATSNNSAKSETNAKSTKTEISQPCKVKTYIKEISCNKTDDGAIGLEHLTGTPPFKYEWSNGATTKDIMNLKAGTYTVKVTDAAGSVDTQRITLKTSTKFSVKAEVQDVTATGARDGKITFPNTPSNYSVMLYGPERIRYTKIEEFKNLPEGNYTIVVANNLDCTTTVKVKIGNKAGSSR